MSGAGRTRVGLSDEPAARERALRAATQVLEDNRAATTELQIELCEIADELNDLYRHFVQFIDESGLAREVERKIDVINPSTSESPGIPKAT